MEGRGIGEKTRVAVELEGGLGLALGPDQGGRRAGRLHDAEAGDDGLVGEGVAGAEPTPSSVRMPRSRLTRGDIGKR